MHAAERLVADAVRRRLAAPGAAEGEGGGYDRIFGRYEPSVATDASADGVASGGTDGSLSIEAREAATEGGSSSSTAGPSGSARVGPHE